MKKITFISDGNKLSGTLYQTDVRKKSPGILFLHGAGNSSSARFNLWQQYLCDKGYTSFIFDCRGVGESEGEKEDGGLNNRLRDAENALKTFISTGNIDEDNICVVGNSMSGHTAVQLTQKYTNIKALILAYAAAYSEEAENKKLDHTFTEALRKENSWIDSPAFSTLQKYLGKVLVIYGEHEDIIPQGVQKRFVELGEQKGESHIIKNAGHRMLLPTNEKEEQAMQELFQISASFLDKTFKTKEII